jgi:hypothetical protein
LSDSQALTATLAQARRRLVVATFVRWACSALTAGVAGLVAATLLAGEPLASGRSLLIVATTALALAAVVTAWRRPTLAQTATALDARLGLADLAIAAHALRDNPQPMAQLVVREARQRLASASLSRVLPMPRRLATWTSGASVAALLLGVLAGGGRVPAGNLVPAGGTGRVVSGAGSTPQRTGAAAASAASTEGPSTRPAPREPGTGPASPRPTEALSPGSQTRTSPGAIRGQQAGTSAADGASDAPGRTAGRSGNAGRGAADPQATPGVAAGGVQQGTGRAAGATPVAATDSARTAEDLRRAARRAEAAVARDEIPPRMKPLVRRYFQSMQSESGR